MFTIDVLTNFMFLKLFLIIGQLNIECKGEVSHAISEPLDSISRSKGQNRSFSFSYCS